MVAVLTITSSITTILLGIIAFWLKRFVGQVDSLTASIQTLQVTTASKDAACAVKHTAIDSRLRNHDQKFDKMEATHENHETRITILEKTQK